MIHVNLEPTDNHTITSYSDSDVTVNGILYQQSFIISPNEIISPWPAPPIDTWDTEQLTFLLQLKPEVILIGQASSVMRPSYAVMAYLSKQQIGLECMSIGAACRTFNVLLSEYRHVVLGILL